MLKRPAREPRPPARRAYAPEGTEKKPIVCRSIRVMQRSPFMLEMFGNKMKLVYIFSSIIQIGTPTLMYKPMVRQ
ncbi:MAG: hypothetical protein ACQEQO_04280 [Thermodesulfobacteriota bacterium]